MSCQLILILHVRQQQRRHQIQFAVWVVRRIRYRPAEVLWYNKKANLIRERETFDDILKNQVEIDFTSKKETVFSFTTRLSDSIFTLDSTKRKSLQLKGFSAEEILIDSLKIYVTKKDSILIGSNTKTELEQIINSKQKPEYIKNLINDIKNIRCKNGQNKNLREFEINQKIAEIVIDDLNMRGEFYRNESEVFFLIKLENIYARFLRAI